MSRVTWNWKKSRAPIHDGGEDITSNRRSDRISRQEIIEIKEAEYRRERRKYHCSWIVAAVFIIISITEKDGFTFLLGIIAIVMAGSAKNKMDGLEDELLIYKRRR